MRIRPSPWRMLLKAAVVLHDIHDGGVSRHGEASPHLTHGRLLTPGGP
ncbi:hypothetical protein ACFS5L_04500 [Streptomyces phyllanthi]|nr:hypothetical protein [Streptomyces phyllanthi]